MAVACRPKPRAGEQARRLAVATSLFAMLLSCPVAASRLRGASASRALMVAGGESDSSCPGPNCKLTLIQRKEDCQRPKFSIPDAPALPPPRPPSPPLFPGQDADPPSHLLLSYCARWHTAISGQTCNSIVANYGLPSVDWLRRQNPALNCASIPAGIQLCVHIYSQWALVNCYQVYVTLQGDSCDSIQNKFQSQLAYGLAACNQGGVCMNGQLLNGMQICVSCVPSVG